MPSYSPKLDDPGSKGATRGGPVPVVDSTTMALDGAEEAVDTAMGAI